jgi:hypothetical protein
MDITGETASSKLGVRFGMNLGSTRANKKKQEETRELARPERFELPTNWFEASYSIQLSYGRVGLSIAKISPPVTVRLRYLLLLDSRRQTPYP